MLNPDDVSLWIVAFRREEATYATLNCWLDSFGFNDINLIANDPRTAYADVQRDFPQVKVWRNLFRDGWETGAIAWCWNQCMRHTFEKRRWCLMSQDDVTVLPGWDNCITDDYDTYIAPAGDTVQLQSIEGFAKAGWFDERFRVIGGPENDYLLRCLQEYPDRLSVHDEHIWQLRHNTVGLGNLWRPASKDGEVGEIRFNYNYQFAFTDCFPMWNRKWGQHVDELFIQRVHDGQWRASVRQPGWEEIDWYPSFTRRLKEIGRWPS